MLEFSKNTNVYSASNGYSLHKMISVFFNTRHSALLGCPWQKNIINVIDIKTKEQYVSCEGVGLKNANCMLEFTIRFTHIWNNQSVFQNSWTHVKEIPNTTFLVSIHHCAYTSVNMEICEISKKWQAQKIYSFGNEINSKLRSILLLTHQSSSHSYIFVTGNGDVIYYS